MQAVQEFQNWQSGIERSALSMQAAFDNFKS